MCHGSRYTRQPPSHGEHHFLEISVSLSNLREQVRAQVRGEQTTVKSLKNLTPAERAAVRAMRSRAAKASKTGSFLPTDWWV
jgi:hypothetical protein